MSHFAEIDKNNIVLRVIVAEQDFIDTGIVGNKENWIQTSYNTSRGVHKDNKTPLRKNYAGIGHIYDETRDAFIPQKPFPSWELNADTCQWEPPTPYPDDGKNYYWDEDTISWKEIELRDE